MARLPTASLRASRRIRRPPPRSSPSSRPRSTRSRVTELLPRPAWADIDLGAIRRNVSRIGEKLNPTTQFMAVVKANAYGHGDVGVARAAIEAGATWLGVIPVDEGVRLREAGIDAPILLLHEAPVERIDEALANQLTPCVFTEKGLWIIG